MQSISSITTMTKDVLIVEDEFLVANDLKLLLQKSGYLVCGIATSVKSALELIEQKKPGLVLLDIYLEGDQTGVDLAKILRDKNIAFVYLSANSDQKMMNIAKATQPYGFLIKPFREKDLLVTLDIAHYRHAHSLESNLRLEQSLQIELGNCINNYAGWQNRFEKMAQAFQLLIPFDYLEIGFESSGKDYNEFYGFNRIGFQEYQILSEANFSTMMGLTQEKYKKIRSEYKTLPPGIYQGIEWEDMDNGQPIIKFIKNTFKAAGVLTVHLPLTSQARCILSFFSSRPDTYHPRNLELLGRLKQPLTLLIDRQLAFDEVARLSDQLKRENSYLQEEVKTKANFEEIIGTSRSLLMVFDKVTQVAPLDTSVLILGESGTGKELIAGAIHNLSPRRKKLMVKINCAALPANLIESELFGHERGAFTGALEKRIGKFELANGGTIFLDEIGEMPLELQVKLLRVLQEKEFERIGGNTPIKMNARVIAATNRNLENEIIEKKFRLDLYYRLNVFPITLPPLRDRKEDIALLAENFARKISRRIGKGFHGFTRDAMDQMMGYNWPGNIRELENVIEQALITSDGRSSLNLARDLTNMETQLPKSEKHYSTYEPEPPTLHDIQANQHQAEKEYILAVLKETNGRIRGAGGAAEKMNIKPTTLEYKMEKLGIKKIHT